VQYFLLLRKQQPQQQLPLTSIGIILHQMFTRMKLLVTIGIGMLILPGNTVQTLPTTITVMQDDRYPLTYNGDDPWKNNAQDKIKYKSKKGGGSKMKSK